MFVQYVHVHMALNTTGEKQVICKNGSDMACVASTVMG